MTNLVNKLAPQIWSEIDNANTILLTCHQRPDPDSVATNLAMKNILEKMSKKVTLISGDDPVPSSLSFLPGYKEILLKSFGELNISDFDLYICLDIGSPQRISNKSLIEFPLPIPTIVIDHHQGNPLFGSINLVDKDISSTSELLWYLVKTQKKLLIDADFATCIYTGVWSDSVGLVYVSPETMRIVSECMVQGADQKHIIHSLLITQHSQLVTIGEALSRSKLKFSDKVVIASIEFSDFKRNNVPDYEIGDCKELLNTILGKCAQAVISSVIYEYESGRVSTSIRSNSPSELYDISKVAQVLGGGGHPSASSAKLNGSTIEAEKLFINSLQRVYPQLGNP